MGFAGSFGETFDRSSLTDKVYALLKDRILSQDLAPGQKVDIDRLGVELGISRTPVKDALNRLASDGLVTILPRRGTFVARFDLNDLLELIDVRLALEVHAVRLGAGRATPEQVQQIRDLVQGLEADFPGDQRVHSNYDAFLARDRSFHLLLVATAGNQKLLDLYQGLDMSIQMARAYYLRGNLEIDRVHAEHHAILETFERGDSDAAVRATRDHLERVKHSLRQGMGGSKGS